MESDFRWGDIYRGTTTTKKDILKKNFNNLGPARSRCYWRVVNDNLRQVILLSITGYMKGPFSKIRVKGEQAWKEDNEFSFGQNELETKGNKL